jgi:radial spoke head protein 4A
MIKYAFTGDLNANINSCPPFPGKERHFLRAQLARIEHSTELCPNGTFIPDEENEGQYKINAEPIETGTDALKDFANWTHSSQAILSNGRCSFLPVVEDPEDPEGSAEKAAKQEAE